MIFKSSRKAKNYLNRTFVVASLDGRPEQVRYMYTDPHFNSCILGPTGERETIRHRSEDIFGTKFKTPCLGYLFHEDHLHLSGYMERVPSRMWRVGISSANTVLQNTIGRKANVLDENIDVSLKLLQNCQDKSYPTFEQAQKLSFDKPDCGEIPFSRKYAVHRDEIYHKGKPIGPIIGGAIEVSSQVMCEFHNRNIGSISGVEFFFEKKEKELVYGQDDI